MLEDAATGGNRMFGPFVIYVSVAAGINMLNDFKDESDISIMERVLKIPQIAAVRPSEHLTGDEVIMVQMTSDVVDLIDGIQPTVVMWESNGGFLLNFKVLAIVVPRIKSTAEEQCGIIYYT
jgi:hypothetical protein